MKDTYTTTDPAGLPTPTKHIVVPTSLARTTGTLFELIDLLLKQEEARCQMIGPNIGSELGEKLRTLKNQLIQEK